MMIIIFHKLMTRTILDLGGIFGNVVLYRILTLEEIGKRFCDVDLALYMNIEITNW